MTCNDLVSILIISICLLVITIPVAALIAYICAKIMRYIVER